MDYARQWAIRCVHEAQMHPVNSFITLTYSDEHLKSPRLVYSDWQDFMKRLRKTQNAPIGVYPKGEYGEQTKRPHWHAILFNWSPSDLEPYYKNERGDQIYTSRTLDRLWGKNDPESRPCELGSVTLHSAGYVARYSAKKLVHGRTDDYQPIGRPSSKHAIGKKWLEVYYRDVFNYGKVTLKDGSEAPIPRYYEKWFKENHFEEYLDYLTRVKYPKMKLAEQREAAEQAEYWNTVRERLKVFKRPGLTRNQVRNLITKSNLNQLQSFLKL